MKDREIAAKDEEITRKDDALASKDRKITSLKIDWGNHVNKLKMNLASKDAEIASLKSILSNSSTDSIDTAELTSDDEHEKNSPARGGTMNTNVRLAVQVSTLQEQNRNIVCAKQEKNAAESISRNVKPEKKKFRLTWRK